MKGTGITRPIDDLGRVVIPSEIRKAYGLDSGDRVEFLVDGEQIIIQKYRYGCHCCDSEAITEVLGIKLCSECTLQFEKARKVINKAR